MKQIKLIVTIFFLLIFNGLFAQNESVEVGFFETYQDYQNNKVLNVGTFGANDSNKVIFTKDGKNIMYPATKITY